MQILITGMGSSRTRSISIGRGQLIMTLAGLAIVWLLLSGVIYNLVLVTAARQGWPVVSRVVRLVVRDEFAQRDRFMRENLDAMAQKVGTMQARLIGLEALSDRLSGLAGIKGSELKDLHRPQAASAASGGPYLPLEHPSLKQLNDAMAILDEQANLQSDLFTLTESRLFESRMSSLMIPSSRPVEGPVGSGFGFRSDPFTGHAALHTGLDFPAPIGTPIKAAAGGVVLSTDWHSDYGNLLQIDHGNGVVTRYAHTSKILVKVGDLVRRGQEVALVGTTGRSTGPHLHFEVVLDGVPQNPARFLALGPDTPTVAAADGKAIR